MPNLRDRSFVCRFYFPIVLLSAFLLILSACGGGGGKDFTVNVNNGPVIDGISDQNANVGELFSYQVVANDPELDAVGYALVVKPLGMTISTGGLINWTPGEGQSGTHSVAVSAEDSHGNKATETFHVIVSGGTNRSPIAEPVADQPAQIGTLFTYQIVATDPDNDTLSYSLTTQPTGMTIDGSTGIISWIPQLNQTGYNNVTVAVNDGRGATIFVAFVVATPENGNLPPVLPSIPDQTTTEGTLFVYENIIADDPNHDSISYTLLVELSTPPSWLQLADDGFPTAGSKKILGTPVSGSAGTYFVSLKADDGRGGIHTVSFTLTVNAATGGQIVQTNSAPVINTVANDNVTIPAFGIFRTSVNATDPDNDLISFAITNAPAGIAINTRVVLDGNGYPQVTGIIEWRPTRDQSKEHQLELIAQDSHGGNSTPYTITVNVVAADISDHTMKLGGVYNYPLPHITSGYKYRLLGGPAGMKLYNAAGVEENPVTDSGRLNWTPAATSQSAVTLRILKASDGSTVQDIVYNVNVVTDIDLVSSAPADRDEIPAGFESHNIFIEDYNNDSRKDLIHVYNRPTSAEGRVSYWTNQSDSTLSGARTDIAPPYATWGKNPWDGYYTTYHEPTSNRTTGELSHYTKNVHVAVGRFYDTDQLEYVWVWDDNTSSSGNRLTIMVQPWNSLSSAPIEIPLSYSATGTDEPGEIFVDDVVNRPPDGSGKDYDNANEIILLDRGNRKLIVVTADQKIAQALDLAHTTADANYMRMAIGDVNGDGLKDVCVVTNRWWFASGAYRTAVFLEVFLQTDTGGGNYVLVSQNASGSPYKLDEALNPLLVNPYDYNNLCLKDITLGDVNADGKDEIAVAFRMRHNWIGGDYSNNTNYDSHYSNYDYVKVYRLADLQTATVSPAVSSPGRYQNIWVGTNSDLRVTSDNGATWTTYSAAPLNLGVKSVGSSHRHHYNSSNNMLDKRYVWIGTDGGGLVRMDPGAPSSFTTITSSNSSLPSNTVNTVAGNFAAYSWDRGPIWIGTTAGLAKWAGPDLASGWNAFTTSSVPAIGGSVVAMCSGNYETNNNANFFRLLYSEYKFIGCTGGADAISYIVDNDNIITTNFDKDNTTIPFVDNNVNPNAMNFEPYLDMKWYGTNNGLYNHKGNASNTLLRYTTSSGNSQLLSNVVKGVVGAGLGTLDGTTFYRTRWVATAGGVCRMLDFPTQANPNFAAYTTTNGLVANNCTAIVADSDRGVWVGTVNGVTRFSHPSAPPWTTYATANYLPGAIVQCMYVEPHPWNQISSIEIADVTGDGQKDLVVISNGYIRHSDWHDEYTKWDAQHPVNGKLSVLPQAYSGGAFSLSNYVPNTPGREVIFTSVYSDTIVYTPFYRKGIAIGKVTSDYGPDIFVSGYRNTYIGHFKYTVTP